MITASKLAGLLLTVAGVVVAFSQVFTVGSIPAVFLLGVLLAATGAALASR